MFLVFQYAIIYAISRPKVLSYVVKQCQLLYMSSFAEQRGTVKMSHTVVTGCRQKAKQRQKRVESLGIRYLQFGVNKTKTISICIHIFPTRGKLENMCLFAMWVN